MKRLIKLGWLIVLACLPFRGWGQTTQTADTLRINLEQALDIALSDNLTVKIAEQEVERVDYSKKAAWYGLLPTLDATAQYAKYVIPASMSMMGQIMDSPTDFTATAGLNLSLPLFAPALWNTIKMTTLDMQLATEKARASKVTLRNDVTKAYYAILLAQDSYKSLQEGYDIAKKNYEEAQNRYNVGMVAEYDFISAEVQMNNLLPNLLHVENGIIQAKLYLKVLMGVNASIHIVVEGNLADYENEVRNMNGIRNFSLLNNTDLRQLDIQQQQLQKSLSIQRTQRMPTLAAFGQYGYNGTGNKETTLNFAGNPIVVNASTDWYSQGLIVGLQLNIPLFHGFSNTIKEKQIKIQTKSIELQRSYLENSLDVQVRTALDNMDRAAKQVETTKKGMDLSRKGYDIADKRYQTGVGTMLELQSAALALTQSRLSYHQAISDYLTAKADYEKLIGQ
jgi:outer membrane protein TolC